MKKEAPPRAWCERQSLDVAPLLPTLTSPGFCGVHAPRFLLPGPPRVSPPLLPSKTVREQTKCPISRSTSPHMTNTPRRPISLQHHLGFS